MANTKLLELLDRFSAARLLVIGDLMLDRFIWGDVERISPEAPVPVLRVNSESFRLGGAANVIHNIRSLGGSVTACGVVGRDTAGQRVLSGLKRTGAKTAGVYADARYQTIQKTRIIASPHHQQIVRLDREDPGRLSETTLLRLRGYLMKNAGRYDGVVISDYGKGVVHQELLSAVAALVRRRKLVCVVDPKKENYGRYRYPTLVTPNKSEASEASGIAIHDEKSLRAAGLKLRRLWRADAVMITRGPDGVSLFRGGGSVQHFPTQTREIFDVTGAGDTVVAVCALSLACGASYRDTAVLANLAAGMVGDEIGTVAVARAKLRQLLKDDDI